ncbi:hypothetical protein D3C84_716960 [compost metagenome]
MHAPVQAELVPGIDRYHLRELDLALVQILAGDLRQRIDLLFQCIVQAGVGVAEVDRRIPHLQVEIGLVAGVPDIRAFAAAENTGWFYVVDGVAVGAIAGFFFQKKLVFSGGDSNIRHAGKTPVWRV